MKRVTLSALLMLALSTFLLAGDVHRAAGAPGAAAPSLPAGVQEEWWARVQSDIQREEYAITFQDGSGVPGGIGVYQAPNRAHGFRTAFTEAGIKVVSLGNERGEWEWGLELVNHSAEGVRPPVLKVEESRIEIRRGWITEWYINSPAGLEQGFTVFRPPVESRRGGAPSPPVPGSSGVRLQPVREGAEALPYGLHLDLALTGTLHPRISEDGQAVDFYHPGGNVSVLRYADLKVTDATGRVLPSRFDGWCGHGGQNAGGQNAHPTSFHQPSTASAGGIRISIDDAGAVYPITVDPLATSPAWTAVGEAADNLFGSCVATAGDVNGDGYSDVVVGAYGYSSNSGKAYLYLGGPAGLSTTASWTAVGEAASDFFGSPVATAGDVNGDGYSDVVVGAYGFNGASGKAYLYLGGPSGLSATAPWTAVGESTNHYFGCSVASAGDVNGDGYSDVVVGASWFIAFSGKAYLYLGGPSGLSETFSWMAVGEGASDYFGSCVATAGDVNGDGYSDVLVTATGHGSSAGKAYLYLGGASGLSATAAWSATGEEAGDYFGMSVATAGDVNGDGYSDVLVGADLNSSYTGKAYLYMGGASGLSEAAVWTVAGEGVYNYFGTSVATAGDVNGDGYADVLVGARMYSSYTGKAYLYLGGVSGLSDSAAWTAVGEGMDNGFGHSVATAGDVNGDGYSDVLVGASMYSSFAGKAYLYLGGPAGPSAAAGWRATGEGTNNYFTYSVATAGDVNGDGYSDVVVGAFVFDGFRGKAYLYLGGATGLSDTAAWTAVGENAGDDFGIPVATAGDVNGDGYSDVLVGAFAFGSATGKAYLYLGGAMGLSATAAWTAVGEVADIRFGWSVATAGDVNGDGYSDVVVGAHGFDSFRGKAYLYLGGATGLSATAAWTVVGYAANDVFGWSVATAGDVNWDGYSDVVVGARGYNSQTGKAYVYLGGPAGLSETFSWTAVGEAASNLFGWSLATAGDVNGDGYSDVAVGAPGKNTETGKAYVYLGGASGLSSVASWTAVGEGMYNLFGYCVAAAGDVNGDGYSDVAVGAHQYAGNTGKAYVYLGGASGLSAAAAWTAEGEAAGNYFGHSVAAAGDVNGDGYSDVMVGAYGYVGQTGRAYLYYGNGGAGVPVKPQQRRSDDLAPVDKLGWSDSPTAFRLAAAGRTPLGRCGVKLEMEVKPLGTIFNGAGTRLGASWTDSGISGAALNELVSSLPASTNYHWRERFHYNPATMPFQTRSRWFAKPWGGWQETDLGTVVTCRAPHSLTNNTAADLDCGDTGVRVTWAQDAGAWGDSDGTRTYDVLRDGSPLQTGIAYGTTSLDDVAGTNGTAYTYTVRYNNGCGMSAATSGASAADVITPPEVETVYLRKEQFYPAGIVSAWHFDEGSGTNAVDTPGTNNGTLANGPIWTAGHSGTALSFDGWDDYVSVPNSSSLNPTQITVVAWIKADTWTEQVYQGSIVAKDQISPDSGWVLRCGNGGRLSFVVSVGGWRWIDTEALMSLNTWTHVAGTYDGTTLRAYINGVDRGSSSYSGSITPSTMPVWMGSCPGFTGRLFDGTIDDAAVFNRALSGTEIQDLYQKGFDRLVFEWTPLTPAPGSYEVLRAATAYWPFDTQVGTVGGTSGSTSANLGAQPATAFYKIRAVTGGCPGPM